MLGGGTILDGGDGNMDDKESKESRKSLDDAPEEGKLRTLNGHGQASFIRPDPVQEDDGQNVQKVL